MESSSTDDASTTTHTLVSFLTMSIFVRGQKSHMMLFAIFMKALRIPLFGLALSKRSSTLNPTSADATLTVGATMSVKSGARS